MSLYDWMARRPLKPESDPVVPPDATAPLPPPAPVPPPPPPPGTQTNDPYAASDFLPITRAEVAEAAAGVILVHNHPSGDPTPSAEDRAVTRQLVAAGQLLDLPVYDHVVVAGDRWISFAQCGLL